MVDIIEKTYTIEEYLSMGEASPEKLEYINGNIITMPEGTARHNEIAARLIAALIFAIDEQKKSFRVYSSDMKIQIPAYNYFVYPDTVVVSEKPEFYNNRQDIITNPLLIVEVLSPATQHYDRQYPLGGGKFLAYCTLPSFKEYVVVNQDKPLVTAFFRKNKHQWEDIDVEGIKQSIHLQTIGCKLALSQIYKGIDFSA